MVGCLMYSKTISMDSAIMENMVASPTNLDKDEHESERLDFEGLTPYFALIPEREVDLIEMYFQQKKRQIEIARFFSISQGAVSHRLTRAYERLQFLRDMPKVDDLILIKRLKEVLPAMDAEITFYMIRTTCQTETADIINKRVKNKYLTQVKVRHKFKRSVNILKKKALEDQKYILVASLADYINEKGLYMLHEVKLPHFFKGTCTTINMVGRV